MSRSIRAFNSLRWWLAALVAAVISCMSWQAFAQTTSSCVKPNILLVLNKSSNMSSSGKWNNTRLALGQIVSQRNANSRFGLVVFDTSARVALTIRDNALSGLATAIVPLQPSGQARHRTAMAAVRAYLSQEIARDTATNRNYAIILGTDGTSSDGDPRGDIAGLRSLRVGNRTVDVRTYVMAASPNAQGSRNVASWAQAGGTTRAYTTQQAATLSSQIALLEQRPRAEQCNGQDDDCDGQVDENLQRFCLALCPSGTTAGGRQTCSNGNWGSCQATPSTEFCNGRDDDCDGKVDNLPANQLNCQTSCGTGTRACVNGRFTQCSAPLPSPEICDGKDNDCDGEIDERCPCQNGQTRPCGKTTGECTLGTQICQNGVWSPICQGEGRPTAEQCDGKDNDCDGLVDENVRRTCNNLCGRGIETCTNGKFTGCTAPQPKAETCNGQDDDCDGVIDENCQCQVGQTRPCGTNTGACTQGFQVCITGRWSTNCINSTGPSNETCDRVDNDCDGTIDENLTRPCQNGCGTGTERCSFGRWFGCTAPTPSQEVCDGKDNDCDGQVDENISQSCYTGPTGTNGKGACRGGTQTCSGGKFGACTGEVLPKAETCDGTDNDCDGVIDEGCACKAGDTRDCGVDTGACAKGKQSCINGKWSECQGEIKPKPEDCNGQDDDCDGQVDETLVRNCQTPCGQGSQFCQRGQWSACSGPTPRPEVCGNNQDDDCDGQIDETCPCRAGQTRPCGSGVGECQQGVQECVSGTWSDVCKGGTSPTPEVCDGKDNDCNGTVDDGVACQCKDGETRSCYTGPPGTEKTGACKAGTQTCTNGAFGPCQGQVVPGPETCDGNDEDCDGQVDETIPPRTCQTPCGTGQQVCRNGAFGACSAPPPAPEICDGKDNDCDGEIDEGCPCRPGQTRPCGNSDTGECKRGIQRCVNGRFSNTCEGEVKPTKETCDGKDNDCDGNIDNGITCGCKPGETKTCYTGPAGTAGVGSCKTGTQTCGADGKFGACQGDILPGREGCDGVDNDCNGRVDDGVPTRPCRTACGTGIETCRGGRYQGCTAPQPAQEVCDGRDDDCDGRVDNNAPCPPNSACIGGRCVPNVDGGPPDFPPPPDAVGCSEDGQCPFGFVCRNRRCVSPPDARPEPPVVPDTPIRPDIPVTPDTTPDAPITPDTNPDAVPDNVNPPTACQTNGECGTDSVCRWGRCVRACQSDAICAVGEVCRLGLCVAQCVVDKHCPSGQVCRAGSCKAGCRIDSDCGNGGACVGYACADACTTDADCGPTGGHCFNGTTCQPRCNLAADCPAGFACVSGKCEMACSSFEQSRSCGDNKTCSAGRCGDDCSAVSCSGNGTYTCTDKRCVANCSVDQDCAANEACLSNRCVPFCSIQDDCPSGSRCSEGLCYPTCKGTQDCPSGRACLLGRCVEACGAPTGGTGADGGTDASPSPAPDIVVTPDTGTQQCSNPAQLCSGTSCQATCTDASNCKTGYGCGPAAAGATSTICLPPCRVDVDCPGGFNCSRGLCTANCKADQDCEQGEQCTNGKCVRSCQADADCPLPQLCQNNICQDPDPLKKDRGGIGGGIPKLKLAGGCGCQSTRVDPASMLVLLMLLLLAAPLLRRRRSLR